jgi:hydrogenase maturation protease
MEIQENAAGIAVLGLGNVLMGDDGAGPWVLQLLEAGWEVPPDVELLDLGTPGPELAHRIEGREALVVVDTLRLKDQEDNAPGDLHLLRRDDIVRGKVPQRLSPHDPSLRGALLAAELLGSSPREVLLVGIVPERVELGLGLTPAVQEAAGLAAAVVAAELKRLGVEAPRRAAPHPPAPSPISLPSPGRGGDRS